MSKPPNGKPAWGELPSRRVVKGDGFTIVVAERPGVLSLAIRAFEQGDGATVSEHWGQILIMLRELRHRRESARVDLESVGAEASCHGTR